MVVHQIERFLFVNNFKLQILCQDSWVSDAHHLNLFILLLVFALSVDVIGAKDEIFSPIKFGLSHVEQCLLATVWVTKWHHLFVDFYANSVQRLSNTAIFFLFLPLREVICLLFQLYFYLVKNMDLLFRS